MTSARTSECVCRFDLPVRCTSAHILLANRFRSNRNRAHTLAVRAKIAAVSRFNRTIIERKVNRPMEFPCIAKYIMCLRALLCDFPSHLVFDSLPILFPLHCCLLSRAFSVYFAIASALCAPALPICSSQSAAVGEQCTCQFNNNNNEMYKAYRRTSAVSIIHLFVH